MVSRRSPIFLTLVLLLAFSCAVRGWSQPAPAVENAALKLDLIESPAGVVVTLDDLKELLDSLYPGVSSQWDPDRGMLRIEVAGHRYDAFTGHHVVILDGKIVETGKVLRREGERMLVPIESVQAMLRGLGVEFEMKTVEGTTAPTPQPQSPVTPALPAAPTPPADGGTELPAVNLSVISENVPPPQMTPPPGAMAVQSPAGTNIPLTWEQVADEGHRRPPELIAIVCDRALEPVAQNIRQALEAKVTYRVKVIVAQGARRDQEALRRSIEESGAELVVDLIAQPPVGAEDAPPPPIAVWVVNEALWPQDRLSAPNGSDPARRYQRHQFQSMMLGALLRGELDQRYSNRLLYDLVPAWLLRRIDAPSAAVMLPAPAENPSAEGAIDPQAAGEAVAAAIMGYAEGIRRTL